MIKNEMIAWWWRVLCWGCFLLWSCAPVTRQGPSTASLKKSESPLASPVKEQIKVIAESQKPDPSPEGPSKQLPPAGPSALDLQTAKNLVATALRHYRGGEYQQGEALLKQAILLHPFSAPAKILLGKIFLIRGSAERDQALLDNARLMFEMARAIDPGSREATLLLELFQEAPSD